MKKRTWILTAVISFILLATAAVCAVVFLNFGIQEINQRDATTDDRAYFRSHSVYSGSYKSELTKDELVFYNAFEQHYVMEDSIEPFEIDVKEMNYLATEETQIFNIVQMSDFAFVNDHPEIYWVNSLDIKFDKDSKGQYIVKAVVTPHEKYEGAYSERDVVQNGIETAVNDIRISRDSESRYDTVKAIHDYICDNLSYYPGYEDKFVVEQQCAAPLFGGGSIGKMAVCEGYSLAFKLLCDRFDVPSAVIHSRSHVFNYVQMDDACYYAVDCTWDDGEPKRYDYFLVGNKTGFYSTRDKYDNPTVWRFNSHYEHVEDWFQGMMIEPFAYPKLSDKAYSFIELSEDSPDPNNVLSGTVTFKFRYKGNDFANKKAKVYFNDKLIATPEIDQNGLFEATYDTSKFYNYYYSLKAEVGDKSFQRFFNVQNPQFEILNWKDEVLNLYEPYEVRVQAFSTENIERCKIKIWTEDKDFYEGSPFLVSGFNSKGEASFVLDPKKFSEGLHRIAVHFFYPGVAKHEDDFIQSIGRSFRVSDSAPDSGEFRFWGQSANCDRNVGEWADFTLKYDGAVTERCQFSVMMDDEPVTPLRQGDDKITDFFDKDGFCRFYLDVTGLNNGQHRVQAKLTKEDGSSVTATNTVNVTDGYFKLELWHYNSSGDLIQYHNNNNTSLKQNYLKLMVKNTSGAPSDRCRVWWYEDDIQTSDYDITNAITYNRFDDGGDFFWSNWGVPDVRYGKHVLKAIFMTPDGTVVEKGVPFHLIPAAKDERLRFSFVNSDSLSYVGNTVDFSLVYDSTFPACQDVSILLDGKPADLQMPEDPASAFDDFGRFFFTLDLTNALRGKHTVEAVLTKKDGAVITVKQTFVVTDGIFKITNWPKAEPVLHGVAEVKVKNLSEDLTVAATVRQYIDGEDMGAVPFDKKGMATLNLNTTGLEKGEHWHKVVFTSNDNVTAERLMRFRVE